MYSVKTITDRMLALVPSDLDKSEGSFISDVLSAVAIEISKTYMDLEEALKQTFAGDATAENLDRRTVEMGVVRLPLSPAIGRVEFTGTAGTVVPAGTLVATENGAQYQTDMEVTIESSGRAIAAITAVEGGLSGNVPGNVIKFLPVTIAGVTAVNNPEPTYGGEDEETDEALRIRYFNRINNQAIDGNIAQYKKWAEEYPGIGRVKIFPLWAGANTVKVSILNTENKVAAISLIADFQAYMDPDSSGLGNGVAPIGSMVTISTATPVTINLSANVVLTEGYLEATGVDEALTAYLAQLAYSKTTVSYIGIGAAILAVSSIDQVQNLLMNGAAVDIPLTSEQIPVLGTTHWTVVSP